MRSRPARNSGGTRDAQPLRAGSRAPHRRWHMRSTRITAGITIAAALALSLCAPDHVRADDERDDVEIRVRAPLESVDCTQQTITMFPPHRLVIDVTATRECQDLADALAAAQAADQPLVVTVKLADDKGPVFVATRVRFAGEDGDGHGDGDGDDLTRHEDGGG